MISILGIAIPSGLVAGLILVGAKHVPRLMNEFGKTMSELRSKKTESSNENPNVKEKCKKERYET